MTNVMTIDPAIAGLDLRPLVAMRPAAAELTERLQAGDRWAIPAAQALLDQEDERHTAARAALARLGIDRMDALDALSGLVSELATGDLGFWLDVIEGRCPHPDEPDVEMLAFVAEHRDELEAWVKRCEVCGR